MAYLKEHRVLSHNYHVEVKQAKKAYCWLEVSCIRAWDISHLCDNHASAVFLKRYHIKFLCCLACYMGTQGQDRRPTLRFQSPISDHLEYSKQGLTESINWSVSHLVLALLPNEVRQSISIDLSNQETLH